MERGEQRRKEREIAPCSALGTSSGCECLQLVYCTPHAAMLLRAALKSLVAFKTTNIHTKPSWVPKRFHCHYSPQTSIQCLVMMTHKLLDGTSDGIKPSAQTLVSLSQPDSHKRKSICMFETRFTYLKPRGNH